MAPLHTCTITTRAIQSLKKYSGIFNDSFCCISITFILSSEAKMYISRVAQDSGDEINFILLLLFTTLTIKLFV